ncbi:MAG: hypothetical protein LBB10_02780 [Bifidobacteriaceae bacterium]|jgi:hypothetical protein|nr:hypothetical protein [Bifidobacteriaceae bacterium]
MILNNLYKKLGALLSIVALCTIGILFLASANSEANSTDGVLPIEKGGTGGNSPYSALTNLGMIQLISSSSTDEQFPSAKAVYDFNQGTSTFSNDYLTVVRDSVTGILDFKVKAVNFTGTASYDLGTLPESFRINTINSEINVYLYTRDSRPINITINKNGAVTLTTNNKNGLTLDPFSFIIQGIQ